ncbi:MAG: hypothetical protein ABW123_07375 [Cystobacter sp.]
MNRRLMMSVSAVFLCTGVLALVMGLVANSRRDSETVTWGQDSFLVKRSDLGQAMAIDFLRYDGEVAASIAGRTDLLCEPPHLLLIDLDGDGELEVFFTTCDESGVISHQGRGQLGTGQLGEQEASQLPVLRSFWFHQLREGGWTLLVLGMTGILLGSSGLGLTALFSRFGRRRAH